MWFKLALLQKVNMTTILMLTYCSIAGGNNDETLPDATNLRASSRYNLLIME